MAQRVVALCEGEYIGIESIYTVINGKQINIPEKVKELREKSRQRKLFCPCGKCGKNLQLVAGDKNLREQHFRIWDGESDSECGFVTEGTTSIYSKIVLKCWLDDKLKANDLRSRVPICDVDDTERKYEFTFLSLEEKIALSYCNDRVNLSDEKINILENNKNGIKIIYFNDCSNGGCNGQYQEGLMKVQNKQGFCLLLSVFDVDYLNARLEAVAYFKDIDGLWLEKSIAKGKLSDFDIDSDKNICYAGKSIALLTEETSNRHKALIEEERKERENRERKRKEEEERRREELRIQEELRKKQIAEREEKIRIQKEQEKEEKERIWNEFYRTLDDRLLKQDKQVIDPDGRRWIKCEYCEKNALSEEFTTYSGPNHINLGECRECSKNPDKVKKIIIQKPESRPQIDKSICPICKSKLVERRNFVTRSSFIGCSNFPNCRYTRNKWEI